MSMPSSARVLDASSYILGDASSEKKQNAVDVFDQILVQDTFGAEMARHMKLLRLDELTSGNNGLKLATVTFEMKVNEGIFRKHFVIGSC